MKLGLIQLLFVSLLVLMITETTFAYKQRINEVRRQGKPENAELQNTKTRRRPRIVYI